MYKGEVAIQKASKHVQEPNAYNIWNKKQSVLNEIDNKFDHFINASPTSLPPGITALDWWLTPSNRASYPCLYRMAINILSIPPISAKPERIFSGARRTISWQRIRLGPGNIEKTECLKSWIRTGLVAGWRKELILGIDIIAEN
jgi:hAT family C-terminal dimerisation region